MKHFLSTLFCLSLILFTFSSCGTMSSIDKAASQAEAAPSDESVCDIHIGCMKGPTAIGMIKLLSDSDNGTTANRYHYMISGTADELTAALLNETLDIAAVPCNLASVLYNKTDGNIVTAAINTLGVLYIVETGDSIQTIEDLKGKTIYSTGQGTTPEYTIRYLLSSYGLDADNDVKIEYKSEATEVVAALSQNPQAAAVLPQPYVTAALNQNEAIRIALDITKEWEAIHDGTVVTGVIVARKAFIDENSSAFESFLSEYQTSTEFANLHIDETAALLEEFDIFKASIAKQAIPYCHVTYVDGETMAAQMFRYLTVLYEQNPASVGGKMPDEGIFYIKGNEK